LLQEIGDIYKIENESLDGVSVDHSNAVAMMSPDTVRMRRENCTLVAHKKNKINAQDEYADSISAYLNATFVARV
jgi:hypothetical protein